MKISTLFVFIIITTSINPSTYLISDAEVTYNVSLSSSDIPIPTDLELSIEFEIVSGNGSVILDMNDLGSDYNTKFPEDLKALFIISREEIEMEEFFLDWQGIIILIPLEEERENRLSINWFGASILTGNYDGDELIIDLVYSKTTGILLSLSIVFYVEKEGETESVVGYFYYKNSNQDIFSDRTQLDIFGYRLSVFLLTPAGIALIVVIISVAVLLAYFFIYRRNKGSKGKVKSRIFYH